MMRVGKVCLVPLVAMFLLQRVALVSFRTVWPPDSSDAHDTIKNGNITNHNVMKGHIPRIVHQEWKTTELPANLKTWRDDCIRMNPGWEFKLWTKDDNLKLVEEHYPELLDLYNSYRQGIKRIDMIRFLYLHKFGGVYMDLDMACMKPFASLFDDYPDKFILANQFKKKRDFTNAFMAAPAGHDIFSTIFNELYRQKDKVVIESTGGLLLQYHVLIKEIYKGRWVEMPFDLFYAQDWIQSQNKGESTYNICDSYDVCRRKYPNAITVHMWAGTWAGGSVSNREWHGSSNITITNYNITAGIASEIYISGILDKDLCWECKTKAGLMCHRRVDYFIERYGDSRQKAIEGAMKESPGCRATRSNTAMSQDLAN